MLCGAASAQEKGAEMERARRLASDAGLREESIGPLVSAARSEAYSQARADKRDLDLFTLRFFLERALYRERLVQGCEAEGYDRTSAENADDGSGRAECLQLVGEWCDRLGVATTQEELEVFAVDALLDAAEQQAGTGAGLAGAVRRRVLREMVVEVAMREDLDRQTAERLVAGQVALGRKQGRVTVPEVAKAVVQAIEELTGRSLAGGEIDDWLYRWDYAAGR